MPTTIPAARALLALLPAAVSAPAAGQDVARPGRAGPPNVILIVADDLGYGDVGPYGQRRIRTPNLDRLAREGTRFTQFYAGSTVCAPSRAALMTGLHTGHAAVRGNREYPAGQEPLPAAAVTVAEVLQGVGYATGGVGKWGLGGPGTEGAPTRQGFDSWYGYLDQRHAHFYYPEWLVHDEERVPLAGNRVRVPDEPVAGYATPGAGWPVVRARYTPDVFADSALAFVDRHRGRPFFLYMAATLPHAELQAPDSALRPYLDARGRSVFREVPFAGGHYSPQPRPRATYAAMVSVLDRDVGRLTDRLRALGLDRHTLVLFTSDNGPAREGGHDPAYFRSGGPLRGGKRELYEGGVRVPMLAWMPGRVPAGRASGRVWAMWDLLPTLAALAGAPAPAGLDGLSAVPLLEGRDAPAARGPLYWEFHEGGTAQAVRWGRWKALRRPMLTGRVELYDLAADAGERRDVAARHPEVAARLTAAMDRARTPSPAWPVSGER